MVTALAALAFTPLLWRRALRLTRRRLQLQVPLSMQEILAERDQLRAEFAVERVRMEQAMARVRAAKGADMAEIGRRTVNAAALADQVTALRLAREAQEAEIQLLARNNTEVEAGVGAAQVALHDAHALVDRLKHVGEARSDEVRHLREDVEGRQAAIAELEAQLAEAKHPHGEGLGGWLKAAVAHVAGSDTAAEDAAEPADGFEAARDRENALSLRRSLEARAERDVERPAEPVAGDALDALRIENVTLRDALAAVRRELAGTPSVDRSAEAALRDSIHALGQAVASMTRDAERRTERGDERLGDRPAGREVAEADALSGLAKDQAPRPLGAT